MLNKTIHNLTWLVRNHGRKDAKTRLKPPKKGSESLPYLASLRSDLGTGPHRCLKSLLTLSTMAELTALPETPKPMHEGGTPAAPSFVGLEALGSRRL
jgi:hypothetical protein